MPKLTLFAHQYSHIWEEYPLPLKHQLPHYRRTFQQILHHDRLQLISKRICLHRVHPPLWQFSLQTQQHQVYGECHGNEGLEAAFLEEFS